MARSKMRSRQKPYFMDLFGLDNALLQALFVLWISLFVGLVVLSAANVVTSSIAVVASYAVSTLIFTLVVSFYASCLSKGGCNKTALLTILVGNITLIGSALALH
jgi:hypothetical protein